VGSHGNPIETPAGWPGPFLSPSPAIGALEPWGVELASGERCTAEQGAHDEFGGRVVDYSCERKGRADDRVLLRGINRSRRRWSIGSAIFEQRSGRYERGPRLTITTAWYALPDNADARAAEEGACSGGALAYAAEAYESANGEPDGPLPEITTHACAGGFAIVLFTQEAPPPGYEASLAFHATASGWAFSGNADFVEAGEFGIPSDAYAQMISILSSRSGSERISF
jgi:hypothetical protein